MAGILFAGDLYLDRFDENGNSTGLVQVGNATMFKITESSDIKTRPSRMKATFGQPLDTVAVHKPAELEISVDELDKAKKDYEDKKAKLTSAAAPAPAAEAPPASTGKGKGKAK